ncbi:hypothetical protein [Alkalinema sp. FACHB-956]|uniref:hypothetical protein n=1 Tax=Alkalinema sp. FACHB-956 TaxID=2692768 RepID=UPI001681D2AB|nr:hypothetical protein [Alkalinema sp. FACHB-956]MBD2327227.1 hypothetical protein [Alkalinema sp. FACHB-956]
MNYKQLEEEIQTLISGAEHNNIIQFSLESIEILRLASAEAIEAELEDSERDLLNDILRKFECGSVEEVRSHLDALDVSMTEDDVRASEFSCELVELLVCIESFLQYRVTQSADQIFDLCISMINWADYNTNSDEYSLDNMLGDPTMRAEIERQKRCLGRPA